MLSRQIALLERNASEWVLTPVTRRDAHHYNPFVAASGRRIGYHRCRQHGDVPTLMRHDSPVAGSASREHACCYKTARAARQESILCFLSKERVHAGHGKGTHARGLKVAIAR